jgi:beta-phosphoglucomutase-like phosphatase (HAD superfamily)
VKPLYIFDLDGTLANMEHRVFWIQQKQKQWGAFFDACDKDAPIEAGLKTLTALRKGGAEVWVWTGRSDEVREKTLAWLHRYGVFHPFWNPMRAPEALLMRKAGDHQADVALKRGWLADLEPPERNRLTAVFEDRSSVVQMWRECGVPCFQVAPGEF